MYDFQLYRSVEDNFPTEIEIEAEGAKYPINADFRVILRAIRVQEREDVSQEARNLKIIQIFYPGGHPKGDPLFYFWVFVGRCKAPEPDMPNIPPVMDYFFDADVIYTSVKMQYGVDLLKTPYLHWYEFLMLIEGLNDQTPLAERMRLRRMKTDHLKGWDLIEARAAKKRVALPVDEEAAGQAQMARFGML